MKTLRILFKDARHLRWEILFSLCMVFLYAATDRYLWLPEVQIYPHAQNLAVWTQVFMALAWAVILSRAVHDEALVGDRQFWVTRPYGWLRLLGAKCAFAALFVFAPLFLADCVILHQAHLLHAGVLFWLVEKILIFMLWMGLPIVALATVTSSITRMLMAMLGTAVFVGVAVYLQNLFISSRSNFAPHESGADFICTLALMVLIPALVIFLQYWRRSTLISIALLVFMVVSLTGIEIYLNDSRQPTGFSTLASGESAPLTVTIDAADGATHKDADGLTYACPTEDSCYMATLPIKLRAVASDRLLDIQAVRLVQSDVSGKRVEEDWTVPQGYNRSNWGGREHFESDEVGDLAIHLDDTDGAKELQTTRDITLTLLVSEYGATSRSSIPAAPAFTAPGGGLCAVVEGTLTCRYPVRIPGKPSIAHWTLQQTCGVARPNDEKRQNFLDAPIDARLGSEPLGPVVKEDFGEIRNHTDGRPDYILCPGSPITFTDYQLIRRRIVPITFHNFDIRPLRFPKDPPASHVR